MKHRISNDYRFIKTLCCFLFLQVLSLYTVNALAQKNMSTALSPKIKSTKYAKIISELDKFIRTEMDRLQVVGLSVVLVDDQTVVWEKGFGFSDLKNRIEATENTVYRMGSISKIFTGFSVMQLAQEGKINLDVPIENYLPEFKIKQRVLSKHPITPRNLLTHHSGLPTDLINGADTPSPDSLAELVNKLQTVYTAQSTGLAFQYSNLGFAVLGRMIEKISNADFASYATDNLFEPLGMNTSSFALDSKVIPHLSKGYIGGKQCPQFPIRELSAGSLYSSVTDLSKMMKMIFADGLIKNRNVHKRYAQQNEAPQVTRFLSKQTVTQMMTQQNVDSPLDLDIKMGLSWQLTNRLGTQFSNEKMAWHDGWLWHFSSFLSVLPEHKLGVAVVTNTDTGKKLVSRIGIKALKKMLAVKSNLIISSFNQTTPTAIIPKSRLKQYAGLYDTPSGLLILKEDKGLLKGRLKNKSIVFTPHTDGSFQMENLMWDFLPVKSTDPNELIFFFEKVDDKIILATLDRGAKIPFGHQIEKVKIPKIWKKRVGVYHNNNKTDFVYIKTLELKIKHGLLIAKITIGGKYIADIQHSLAVKPVSKNHAFTMGIGRYRGDSLQITGEKQDMALLFQGYAFFPE